jgi:hypothetical protein
MGLTRLYVVMRLVGIKTEDHLPHPRCGTVLDQAYTGIAILDRRGELTRLKGCTHALIFGGWHVAVEHKRLATSADSTVKCSYPELPGAERRQLFTAQLRAARPRNPERESFVRQIAHE